MESTARIVNAQEVEVYRGETSLVGPLSWQVHADENWIVFGPNGAGKTTLLHILGGDLFPSRGTISVLGEQFGKTDITELRTRIGVSSNALARQVPGAEKAMDVVMSAGYSRIGRWRECYEDIDIDRATALLEDFSVIHLEDRPFATLSEGERKRILIARALMSAPEILLLDEPSAGLDLGGREDLVELFHHIARDPQGPVMIMVTHHVEEIPRGFSHALLLREGKSIQQGAMADVITSQHLTETFHQPIVVQHAEGRFFARRDYTGGRHVSLG